MKYIVAVLVAGLTCLLAGCGANPAVSIRPLYTEGEKPAPEPAMEGEWKAFVLGSSGVSEDAHWKVALRADGCYEAEREKKDAEKREDKDEKEIYRACLVRLENKLFFDATLEQKKIGLSMISAKDMAPGLLPLHFIGRVGVESDFIRLTRLDANWTKQNVPEVSRESSGGSIVFTGTTQQLRSMIGPRADDSAVMTSPWYLCRPSADCGLRVVNDELKYSPDNADVLQGAGWFFVRGGQYDKALPLLRHYAELNPADASPRALIGLVQLFHKDFPAARSELTAAARLEPKDQDFGSMIAISYFLEGNYPEAHKIFARLEPSHDFGSAMLIVLDYASLHRMGRSKQAEAFLSEQMAHLVAGEQDQLLLLRITGSIKDSAANFTKNELEEGHGVLYALGAGSPGKR